MVESYILNWFLSFQVVEFDKPEVLLKNEKSLFRRMMEASGISIEPPREPEDVVESNANDEACGDATREKPPNQPD